MLNQPFRPAPPAFQRKYTVSAKTRAPYPLEFVAVLRNLLRFQLLLLSLLLLLLLLLLVFLLLMQSGICDPLHICHAVALCNFLHSAAFAAAAAVRKLVNMRAYAC